MPRRRILLAVALALALAALIWAAPSLRHRLDYRTGYLRGGIVLLPAAIPLPPTPGSAADRADRPAFLAMRRC